MDLYNVRAKTDNGELLIGVNVPKKEGVAIKKYITDYLFRHFDNFLFVDTYVKVDNSK